MKGKTHLWSNIIRGATESARLVPIENTLFTQTKVCNFDVPISIKHHVIQLEITVDDAPLMQE